MWVQLSVIAVVVLAGVLLEPWVRRSEAQRAAGLVRRGKCRVEDFEPRPPGRRRVTFEAGTPHLL